MAGREENRHDQQQCRDTKYDLKYCRVQKGIDTASNPRRQIGVSKFHPISDDQYECGDCKDSMIELYGRHVIEEISPRWFERQKIGRYPIFTHLRKSIVDLAGFDSENLSLSWSSPRRLSGRRQHPPAGIAAVRGANKGRDDENSPERQPATPAPPATETSGPIGGPRRLQKRRRASADD